jgi:hypothetical protein
MIKLNNFQKFSYYLLPILLGLFSLIPIYFLLSKKTNHRLTAETLIITAIAFSLLALIIFIKQNKSLKYYSILSDLPLKTKHQIIKEILKSHNWRVEANKQNHIRATGNGFKNDLDLRSWSELIFIELKNKEILVNSICNPDNIFAQTFSFGKNRQNIRDFEFLYLEKLEGL